MWGKPQELWTRPRVGLALSGGAARGMAHIGVLRALARHEIPVDIIAGTSAGALVGGTFAAGVPIDKLDEVARSLRWRDVGKMTLSRRGLQTNAALEDFLRARMPVKRFENLPLPFAAVATDIITGQAVVLTGVGDIPFAIRASCAIPGWYVPVIDDQQRHLVDGGLVANIPTRAARALGADLLIAVDVNHEGAKFLGPPGSILGILMQSMLVVQRTVSAHQLQEADVVIQPEVGHIRWDEMRRAGELIRAGEEATLGKIDEIRWRLEPPASAAPKWYQLRHRKAASKRATLTPH